jgi:hypothetical protein
LNIGANHQRLECEHHLSFPHCRNEPLRHDIRCGPNIYYAVGIESPVKKKEEA